MIAASPIVVDTLLLIVPVITCRLLFFPFAAFTLFLMMELNYEPGAEGGTKLCV